MPAHLSNSFRVDKYAKRHSKSVPRLFNFRLSLGMKPNRIMPLHGFFCSDQSQGYPIILIAKYFGSFPFNHGQNMVIIQESHVSYDPETGVLGIYRRLQTENQRCSSDGIIALITQL